MTTIPETWPVQPCQPEEAAAPTTCGTCGRTWDDAVITSMTPAPSARCPFESLHAHTVAEHLAEGHRVVAWWSIPYTHEVELAEDGSTILVDSTDGNAGDALDDDEFWCNTCNRQLTAPDHYEYA
jgi:hypothetical protein